MNPNQPSRDQIEARITALLLGELPADEAELLRWTISQDAELQKLHGRLLLTVGLVREVVAHPEEASAEKAVPRKLSDERRQKLLAHFKTPRPAPKSFFWLKRIEVRPLVTALALVAIVAVGAALLLPATAKSKRAAMRASMSSQNNASIEQVRQKEAAINEWALENNKVSVAIAAPRVIPPPVATVPAPAPMFASTVAPPLPTEIVLPKSEPTSVESEKGTVYSAQIVGYASLAAPSTPIPAINSVNRAQMEFSQAAAADKTVKAGGTFDLQGGSGFTASALERKQESTTTTPAPADAETEIRVFSLKHASPTEMANELGSVFPKAKRPSGENAQQVTAVADPRTQAVIVTAPKELMPEVSGLMDELDIASDRDQNVATAQPQNGDPQQVAQVLQNMFGSSTVARNGTSSSQNSALQQRAQSTTTSMGTATASIGGGAIAFGDGANFGGFGGGGRGGGGGGFGGRGSSATPTPDTATLEGIPASTRQNVNASSLVQDGKLLYEMGKFKEAEDKLNQALKADPNNQSAFYYLNLDKQANFARDENSLKTEAQNNMVEVAKAWAPKDGIKLPAASPNSSTVPATPAETTLTWNNSGTARSRTENQSVDGWHGGTLLGPIPSAGTPPAATVSEARVPGVSVAASGDLSAPQNLGDAYRSTAGEVAVNKKSVPVLGDLPLGGRLFVGSAMAPTAAPAPSSAPFSAINGFIDDTIATDSGPKNMGEDNKRLPQSGGGTLALNGHNTFAGESVANAGTMVFHNFPTDGVEATDKSSELNPGVAEPKQRILTGFSFNAGHSGQQQSAEVPQTTPFQQRVLGLSSPTGVQGENNKLAYGSSDQALTSGLRNDLNGVASQASISADANTHNLFVFADKATEEQIRGVVANLDKPTGQMVIENGIHNPAPAPVVAPVATQPGMVARFAFAATNAVAPIPTLTQQQLQHYKDQGETEPSQPYWEAKRKLDNLTDFHKVLQAKIASEKLDLETPKSTMVTVVDQAQPAQSQNLWQNLTGKVESKARIEVNPDVMDITGISGKRAEVSGNYDPYLVRTEIETIQSDAVLGKVVDALKLDETWAKKNGGERLSKEAAIALLKKRLDLKPEKNSKLVEIGAISDKPDEAAKIANAVTQAYQDYRLDLRSQNTLAGVKVLEAEYEKSAEQIRLAQAEVDRLAKEANVAQSDQPLPRPAATNAPIPQPEFLTRENAFSTFSMNVSDVSFKLAQASLQKGQMPDAASIRSEEFINAFNYRDPEAAAGQPLAFASERARDPFAHNRDFLRFSVKTAAAGRPADRPLNLVLLLDTSGSMERADRVAIIREALRVLAAQLQPQDTVSVVTFARTARLWADGVPGDQAGATLDKVGGITPDGGTNLEEAMRLAYETAHRHYLAQGVNRVVLLTDGAANLGNVDPNVLKQTVEAQRRQGIALDCFGIGWEDFNDDLLEQLSGNGDGRYAFINSPDEAGTEFAAKLAGALQVAAQDVKVQVEFNPQRVISWRQIGYVKHQLTKEQFRDNTVLAAEIAAQEAGNALYTVETKPDGVGPIATVYVRYRIPGTQDVRERSWTVDGDGAAPALDQSSAAMRLAATASAFSEWLAASPFAQEVTPDELLKDLSGVPQIYGADQRPQQLEWMIRQAKSLGGQTVPVSQPSQSGGAGQSGGF